MSKFFNLFILLFSVFILKSSSEDTIRSRRQKNQRTNSDYTYIEEGKSFYKYHTTKRKYHGAIQVCALEGASLFYPENKIEADAVIEFWKKYSKANQSIPWVFVGITDLVSEGVFVTDDGRPISEVHNDWEPGQPNNYRGYEDCVTMNQIGKYNDVPCWRLFKFICKKSSESIPTTTSTTSPTTTSTTSSTTSCIQSNNTAATLKPYVFWPNATVPFYITPQHFDSEQRTVIIKSLKMFEYNSCIKFAPIMSPASEGQHVMTFINPEGLRRCKIETKAHSNYDPYLILLGYNCLNTPELDMIIMRALGLPFEHNNPSRDNFIDVLVQNIEPGYVQLFTKELILPEPLIRIPYDQNSIMHFGERDYSKNGHKTIKFKSRNFRQNKNGLTPADIKKIALIYGPECRIRDRGEKIVICQTYPSKQTTVSRRKREIIEPLANMSLRVNPNITPPPHIIAEEENTEKPQEILAGMYGSNGTTESLNTLGIIKETDRIIELVNEISALALNNARGKYCNVTSNTTSKFGFYYEKFEKKTKVSDVLGIHKIIADFATSIVDNAIIKPLANVSLRVNPNITPAPQLFAEHKNTDKHQEIFAGMYGSNDKTESLNTLGIVKETDKIMERVFQISVLALNNAREKYCNVTSNTTSEFEFENKTKASDVLGIHKIIADFATSIVDDAASNLTGFCQNSETVEAYQSQCKLENDVRCPRPSKSRAVILECVTNKNPNSVNDKMKIDGVVPTTTLKPNRRKREATNTVTKPKSTEEIKEKKEEKPTEIKKKGKNKSNLKEKVQAMKKKRLQEIMKHDSTTQPEELSSTTDSKVKDDIIDPTRRRFLEKRFKVKRTREKSDWEESDTSLEHIEPEKTLSNKDLLKKVLKLGAGSIFNTKKTKKESVEEEPEGKSVEKEEKTAKSSAESAKTTEDSEKTEEEDEKAVTKTRKEYKVTDESSLEEVKSAETEEASKESDKQKRTQKRGKVPKTVELSQLNKEFYAERKWPDGDVIYVIANLPDYDLEDVRNRLAAVNAILIEKTCVKLREVDAKEAPGFDDYMILDTSPDYVTGRVGRKQNFGSIELFEGGHHIQHTAMVVMAMLGFYFEVSRHDRDKHIRVHNRHIRADKLHHFEKLQDEATLDLPYDFESATHPAWQFWRRVGKKGISTVATYKKTDPDGSIMRALGQNPELLSKTDIIKINSVYGVECFQSSNSKGSVRMLDDEDDVIQ